MESKRLYTPQDAAREFSVTTKTINRWCGNGTLEKIKIPGSRRVYISGSSIERLVTSK